MSVIIILQKEALNLLLLVARIISLRYNLLQFFDNADYNKTVT